MKFKKYKMNTFKTSKLIAFAASIMSCCYYSLHLVFKHCHHPQRKVPHTLLVVKPIPLSESCQGAVSSLLPVSLSAFASSAHFLLMGSCPM